MIFSSGSVHQYLSLLFRILFDGDSRLVEVANENLRINSYVVPIGRSLSCAAPIYRSFSYVSNAYLSYFLISLPSYPREMKNQGPFSLKQYVLMIPLLLFFLTQQ